MFSTLIINRNISEGSCDTEAWSYDAENSALTSQEYFTFYTILKWKMVILNCNNISQYFRFYCIFVK